MINPIKSLDDMLMSAANTAVHAWNFTTGRTRSELSTLLFGAGSIVLGVDSVTYPDATLVRSYTTIPIYSYITVKMGIGSKKMEERENNATHKQMKDLNVEMYKYLGKSIGILVAGISGFFYFASKMQTDPDSSNSDLLWSIGDGLIAASLLISAADSLPPRKNCLSRGYDKLCQIAKSYQRRPAYAIGK